MTSWLFVHISTGQGLENDEGAVLVMQGDGNLVRRKSFAVLSVQHLNSVQVLYHDGRAMWHSRELVLFYALPMLHFLILLP